MSESRPLHELSRPELIVVAAAGGFAVGVVAGLVMGEISWLDDENSYKVKYTVTYTDNGCLTDSPFDPDMGADLAVRSVEGDSVVTVLPDYSSAYEPSQLNFKVNPEGELVGSDDSTANFIVKHCS